MYLTGIKYKSEAYSVKMYIVCPRATTKEITQKVKKVIKEIKMLH